MEKHRLDLEMHPFGESGKLVIPLQSPDKREQFSLDVHFFGRVGIKITYQSRARQVVNLVRLDLGTNGHENPDGTFIPGAHLHLYREGFSDKIAFPLPREVFTDASDSWRTIHDFMRYCNITLPPLFNGQMRAL